jgi:hypothetical protein
MGSNNTRKKLISIDELDNSNFTHIDKLFELNPNGYISIGEFSRLFDGRLKVEILKKIFNYFCFDKKNLNKDDLKYFYFIFTINNHMIKISFICDLIFKKNKKKYNKYQEKIHFYFSQNEEIFRILLSDNIKSMVDRSNLEIKKDQVKNFLMKNFQNFFTNFSFVKHNGKKDFFVFSRSLLKKSESLLGSYNGNENNKDNYKEKDDDNIYISNNELYCKCCLLNKKLNKKPEKNDNNNNNEYEILIENIKEEFKSIEFKNDNLFTISLFEKMMKDIDINIIVLSLISSYLKKKTQKVNRNKFIIKYKYVFIFIFIFYLKIHKIYLEFY